MRGMQAWPGQLLSNSTKLKSTEWNLDLNLSLDVEIFSTT